jgi:tight adherence protein B
MIPLALSTIAGIGVFAIHSGLRSPTVESRAAASSPTHTRSRSADFDRWLRQAGLDEVDRWEFAGVVALIFVLASALGYTVFGGVVAPLTIGGFTASAPFATYRHRRQARRLRAQDAWPRMIEEMRVQTSSLGRSIPQALFAVGRRAPEELRPSFAAAQREWLLTTDLARTFAVLKDRLADPTADMTCETLLVAHELGGTDLDHRLDALADDRRQDVQGRKDARSRQAGARFARLFVLAVPAGMALAGTSIGNGREAYRTSTGQMVVALALALVVGCWVWAGRVMRLPEADRVFKD